jgi:DNA-binding winged helix-turn-helix (wHTH) protein
MQYRFRDFEIDVDGFEVRRHGTPVKMEPRVFEFLLYLIVHRARMVGKVELVAQIWHGNAVSESVIARAACLARRTMGDRAAIRTIHARGYQWMGSVTLIENDGSSAAGGALVGSAARALPHIQTSGEATPERTSAAPTRTTGRAPESAARTVAWMPPRAPEGLLR